MQSLFSNPLIVLSSIALLILLILLACVLILHFRLKRLLGGTSAKSLEDGVASLRKEVKDIAQFRKDMQDYLTSVEKRLQKSVQSVETIRFNPYKGDGTGGNQSFATAFLNQKGSGVIFSSLYGRERVSVFSKPVENMKPAYELSEEEKQALASAEKSLKS